MSNGTGPTTPPPASAAIATEINKRVRDYLQLPRYVACVMLSIDAETQTLQVWNGGCPAALLLKEDGKEID